MAKPKPFDERHLDREWLDQHLAEERREADLLGEIREALFGMQDGLVSTLAVVSTVGGATGDRYPVVVAGIASALAGVFSMAAGEYLSSKSQREIYLAQIEKERAEVDERPEEAEAEVAHLLEAEGLSEASARRVAAELSHAPNALLKTMVEKELGLVVEEGHGALQGAVIMGASFGLASLVPIVPYLIAPPNVALVPSLVVSALVVFAIGVVKSRWTRRNPIASGLEIVVLAAFAGIARPRGASSDRRALRCLGRNRVSARGTRGRRRDQGRRARGPLRRDPGSHPRAHGVSRVRPAPSRRSAVPVLRRRAARRPYRARRSPRARTGGEARAFRVRNAPRAGASPRRLRRGLPHARRRKRLHRGGGGIALDDARLRAAAQPCRAGRVRRLRLGPRGDRRRTSRPARVLPARPRDEFQKRAALGALTAGFPSRRC